MGYIEAKYMSSVSNTVCSMYIVASHDHKVFRPLSSPFGNLCALRKPVEQVTAPHHNGNASSLKGQPESLCTVRRTTTSPALA